MEPTTAAIEVRVLRGNYSSASPNGPTLYPFSGDRVRHAGRAA